jgi:uncharacterized membrane protein YebE (DUF533 family)
VAVFTLTKNIKKMDKKVLIGVGVIALLGVGYLVYRKIQTTSQSPEKNQRRIRVIGKRNVVPEVTEETQSQDTEI